MLRVPSRWAFHPADVLSVCVLIAVAAVAALTFRDYGLGWDDFTHAEYGELLLAYYQSGFEDRRALSFVNLYLYGGGFDMMAALVAKATGLEIFPARRLVGAFVGLMGLFITWRLGRRLGGAVNGPWVGLAALMLLAICPLYYGHMFMNAKDVPFAVAVTALLFALVRALDEYPRPSLVTVLLFGVALGLAIGSRVMGVISASFFAIALVFLLFHEVRAEGVKGAALRLRQFVLPMLGGLVVAYAVLAVVWPWAVVDPLNPLKAVGYFSKFWEVPWKELFDGRPVNVLDMPRSYVPTLFAVQMPEMFLVLALAGTAGAIVAAFVARDLPVSQRAQFLLVAAAAVVPVLLTVIMRPAMYNGIRHFAFVAPAMAVMGGLAAVYIGRFLARHSHYALSAGAAVFALGVAVPVADYVRIHPYQYAHFNRMVGGIEGAEDRYMLDYWGLAFKQAADELHVRLAEARVRQPQGRRWRVATCGPHRAASVALGPQFETRFEDRGGANFDFVLSLGTFYCAELPFPVLVKVERDGVVFATIYDVRGRSVASVFDPNQ